MAPQNLTAPQPTAERAIPGGPTGSASRAARGTRTHGVGTARPLAVALRRLLRWVLLAAATALLARFVSSGWPEVRASLARLSVDHAPLVTLAVAVEALWVYAMSQVYRSALLAFGGTVRRRTALRISMAAFTFSRVLPGGGAAGGAVAARELVALGNPPVRTVASMVTSWWITMTALAGLLVAGISASAVTGTLPPRYVTAPIAALVALLAAGGLVAGAARNPGLRSRLSQVVARAADRIGTDRSAAATRVDGADLAAVGAHVSGRGLLAVLGWGVAVWITDAAALWLALAAFGWHLDLGVLLVAFGVANLISALPELTPGWLGVLEASVAVSLSVFGVPQGIATVGVLLYRLMSYWLPTIAGIPAAALTGRPPRMPPVAATRPASPTGP